MVSFPNQAFFLNAFVPCRLGGSLHAEGSSEARSRPGRRVPGAFAVAGWQGSGGSEAAGHVAACWVGSTDAQRFHRRARADGALLSGHHTSFASGSQRSRPARLSLRRTARYWRRRRRRVGTAARRSAREGHARMRVHRAGLRQHQGRLASGWGGAATRFASPRTGSPHRPLFRADASGPGPVAHTLARHDREPNSAPTSCLEQVPKEWLKDERKKKD